MATHKMKRPVVINDYPVTVAVPADVQDALARWSAKHSAELVAVLEPFGLHPYDIAEPQYRRVVTYDD